MLGVPGSLFDPPRDAIVNDRDLDRRLGAIERHLRGLDDDLTVLAGAVRAGSPTGDDPEPEIDPSRIADVVWACERCSSRLALYDPIDDLLRVRHRDLLVQIKTGPGGWVRVICRGCGHINEIHDETRDEPVATSTSTTPTTASPSDDP